LKKTKILSLLIFITLFMGIAGAVIGYQEYLYRWNNDGNGGTHGGCHGGANTKASVTGTLVLSINETGDLSPSQHFTLEVDILNFTEANLVPYDGRVTVGVPGYQGDNALFTSSLASQTLNRRESVDTYGSYNPGNNNNKFELIAPSKAGTYTLFAVVICAVNQTDASPYNLTYVENSIQITVVGPTPPASGIPGANLPIVIGSIVAVSASLIVIIRKRTKKRGL